MLFLQRPYVPKKIHTLTESFIKHNFSMWVATSFPNWGWEYLNVFTVCVIIITPESVKSETQWGTTQAADDVEMWTFNSSLCRGLRIHRLRVLKGSTRADLRLVLLQSKCVVNQGNRVGLKKTRFMLLFSLPKIFLKQDFAPLERSWRRGKREGRGDIKLAWKQGRTSHPQLLIVPTKPLLLFLNLGALNGDDMGRTAGCWRKFHLCFPTLSHLPGHSSQPLLSHHGIMIHIIFHFTISHINPARKDSQDLMQ